MAIVFKVMLYRAAGTEVYGTYGDLTTASYDAAVMDSRENFADGDGAGEMCAELKRHIETIADAAFFLRKWRETSAAFKATLRVVTSVTVEEFRDGVKVRVWRL